MLLEIGTNDRKLEFDMMGNMSITVGQQTSLPGGTTLVAEGSHGGKSFGVAETVSFLLQHVDSLATGLVGAWLYDMVKGRIETLRINRREVKIDKAEIIRAIRDAAKEDE